MHFLDGWFRIFHEANVRLVKFVTMKMIHVAGSLFPGKQTAALSLNRCNDRNLPYIIRNLYLLVKSNAKNSSSHIPYFSPVLH